MSVKTTRIRIAAMLNVDKATLGLTTVFTTIPRVVQDAELPAVVVLPGPATDDTDSQGDETNVETRTYDVTILAERAAFGTEGEYQPTAEDLISQVKSYLRARPGLELEGETEPQDVVYNARVTGDRGFQRIAYGSNADSTERLYIGSTVLLVVDELTGVTYQD